MTPIQRVVDEAIRNNPRASTRAIARALVAQQPRLFANHEQARMQVRMYRDGKANRGRVRPRVRPAEQAKACELSGVGLPAPEPSRYAEATLPKDVRRWLVLADIHVPHHDTRPIGALLRWAKRQGIGGVLLNGDIADCHAVSPWGRDPRERDFEREMQDTGALVSHIRKALRPKCVVWKIGNHEHRLERYFMQHGGEIFKTHYRSVPELAGGADLVVPHGCPIRHRALTILHGDEWGRAMTSPVNPARGAFLRSSECILSAHEHRTSEHTEQLPISGQTVTCWSIGCLCDLHPQYRTLNRWNWGFAILDTDADWSVQNRRVLSDGSIV